MKKFCGACAMLALGALLLFAGCSLFDKNDGSAVFSYLKEVKDFKANPSPYDGITDYKASFVVNEDLSYSIQVNYSNGDLKDYSAQGTKMEYLGCHEKAGSYESWGVTTHYTTYSHVIKLPEATVTMTDSVTLNERDCTFFILAKTQEKRSDSFIVSLVVTDSTVDEGELSAVVNGYTFMRLQKK